MMVLKKRQILVVVIISLIAIAGYVNRGSNSDKAQLTSSTYMGEAQLVDNKEDGEDFFVNARKEREEGRKKSIETFNALIMNQSADALSKETAQGEMIKIAEYTEVESAIENLVKASGYKDCVCYISDGNASLVVKGDALSETDILKITQIVTEQSGIESEKIKIIGVQ